jgi:hypothetical protein
LDNIIPSERAYEGLPVVRNRDCVARVATVVVDDVVVHDRVISRHVHAGEAYVIGDNVVVFFARDIPSVVGEITLRNDAVALMEMHS